MPARGNGGGFHSRLRNNDLKETTSLLYHHVRKLPRDYRSVAAQLVFVMRLIANSSVNYLRNIIENRDGRIIKALPEVPKER